MKVCMMENLGESEGGTFRDKVYKFMAPEMCGNDMKRIFDLWKALDNVK